jgi:CHAT domain-containing protein
MRRLAFLCVLVCSGCTRSADVYLGSLLEDAQDAWNRGDYGRSLVISGRGRTFSALATRDGWQWKFRCIQAEAYNAKREYSKAAAALDGSLPSELALTATAARVEIDLGAAQTSLRNFVAAERYFGRAAELCRIPANDHLRGELAFRRAALAYLQDHEADAQSLARESLALAKQESKPVLEVNAMTFLAALFSTKGHWGEAVSWLQPTVEASRRHQLPASLQKNLGNLGWCEYNLGDLDTALANLQEAEEISGRIGIEDDRRRWLTIIGLIFSERGDFKAASTYHWRALELARKDGHPEAIAASLHNLGISAFDQEDFKTAVEFNRQEMQLKHAGGDKAGELYGRYLEAYLLKQRGDNEGAANTFSDIIAQSGNNLSLRWQSQIALAKVHIALNEPDLAQKDFDDALLTFHQARQSLSRDEFKLTFRSGLNRYYSSYVKFLVDRGRTFEALNVAEQSRAQVLSERLGLAENPALDLKKLQATARALDATLLSFWLAPNASYLWVVTAHDFAAFTLPSGPEIEKLAESHARTITVSPNPADTRLYQALIAPAQRYIPNNGRVILIPDGALFHINMETLPVPGDPRPHYWIEDATISTATSLALLAPRPQSKRLGNVLLIGNPVSPGPQYPSLPYSGKELHAIADRFPNNKRLLYEGPVATPSAYRQAAPGSFSWIHFAAHGVASKESPMDSAIVLSDEGDSFRLYARDVAKIPLNADLVTISACYGSGTRTFAGEGMVGLAWAFMLAGAHNVVASLWDANDYYAARLMDQLYERLGAGDDVAHALRTAKLSLLHSQYICRNPRYWGAFQLYTGY